jgi:hypothetical protein
MPVSFDQCTKDIDSKGEGFVTYEFCCRVVENERKSARSPQLLLLRREAPVHSIPDIAAIPGIPGGDKLRLTAL